MNIKSLIRLLISAAAIMLLDYFGFWVWLVAHPFWNFKGALIGIVVGIGILVIGLFAAKILPKNKLLKLGLLALCVLIAAGIAIYGKTGFASSFGEDRTAGMFWYYGYLALATASFVTFYEITGFILGRKPE